MRLCGSLMVIITVGSLITAGEDNTATRSRVLLPARYELVRSASHKSVLVNISRWKDEFGEEPTETLLSTLEFTYKQLTFLNSLLEQTSQKAQFDILDKCSIQELHTLYTKLKAKNSQTLSLLFLKALVRVMSQKARKCKGLGEVEELVSATRFDQITLKELREYIPPMSLSSEPNSSSEQEGTMCEVSASALKDPECIKGVIRKGRIFEPRIPICYDRELDVLVCHRQEGSSERVYRQGRRRFIFGFLEKDLFCRIDPVTREPLWSYRLKHQPAVLAFDWNAESIIAFSSKQITMLDVQMGVPIIDGMEAKVPIAAVLLERRKQKGQEVQKKILLRGNNGSNWGYLLESHRSVGRWLACWLRGQYLDQRMHPFCSSSRRNLRSIFKDCG